MAPLEVFEKRIWGYLALRKNGKIYTIGDLMLNILILRASNGEDFFHFYGMPGLVEQ